MEKPNELFGKPNMILSLCYLEMFAKELWKISSNPCMLRAISPGLPWSAPVPPCRSTLKGVISQRDHGFPWSGGSFFCFLKFPLPCPVLERLLQSFKRCILARLLIISNLVSFYFSLSSSVLHSFVFSLKTSMRPFVLIFPGLSLMLRE